MVDVNIAVLSVAGLGVSVVCLVYGVRLYRKEHRSKPTAALAVSQEQIIPANIVEHYDVLREKIVKESLPEDEEPDLLEIGNRLAAALEGDAEHA